MNYGETYNEEGDFWYYNGADLGKKKPEQFINFLFAVIHIVFPNDTQKDIENDNNWIDDMEDKTTPYFYNRDYGLANEWVYFGREYNVGKNFYVGTCICSHYIENVRYWRYKNTISFVIGIVCVGKYISEQLERIGRKNIFSIKKPIIKLKKAKVEHENKMRLVLTHIVNVNYIDYFKNLRAKKELEKLRQLKLKEELEVKLTEEQERRIKVYKINQILLNEKKRRLKIKEELIDEANGVQKCLDCTTKIPIDSYKTRCLPCYKKFMHPTSSTNTYTNTSTKMRCKSCTKMIESSTWKLECLDCYKRKY